MIDLKEIERHLTPERVIELVTQLGSDQYIEKPDYIQFKTICHNTDVSDASLKLYYYKKNKRFHCYTDCGDNFNIFELFKRRYELLGQPYNFYKDIVLVIAGDMDLDSTDKDFHTVYRSECDRYKPQTIDINIPVINSSVLNAFTFYPTTEWLNDGISEQSMRDFNILYSINQNKIIIPHYDKDDNLIGVRGRALNEEDLEIGKYMPVQIEGKIYAHPLGYNLYGLNVVKNNIARMKMAIVAESEKSSLQYNTMFGLENNICVATCGSSFHNYQMELLLEAGAERVLIAFDKEGETWAEKEKYYKKLKDMCLKYRNKCTMGFIHDTKNLLRLKDSPFDRGKQVFLDLYKGAIWV